MKNKPWTPGVAVWEVPSGPVEAHILPFGLALSARGYAPLSVMDYLRSAAHFGVWLKGRDTALCEVTDSTVADFGRHLCRCRGAARHHRQVSRRYLARVWRFVAFVREAGHVPAGPPEERVPVDRCLVGFEEWATLHRGLRPRTIAKYMRDITRVLLPLLGGDTAGYDASLLERTVQRLARNRSRGTAKAHVTALRAFLRFLSVRGECPPYLAQAVPALPQWRLSELPRYLSEEDVEHVLESCPTSTRLGLRDRAVLLLLVRLGLRAGDVTALRVEDIDWESASIRVLGKSRKEATLPLPQEVGDALLEYLVVRQTTTIPQVFLCDNAPTRALGNSATVSGIATRAMLLASIKAPFCGAHVLRHTAATTMLRSGATLAAVASVLRHESADTTAYYAKVDVRLLTTIAQPWPEGSPC